MEHSFFWRRLHSLFGLWIVLFLMEHLFTNSQAGLLPEDRFYHFIQAVNFLHNLPYLHVIEVTLLGVPIAFHALLGIQYAWKGKINSLPFPRNRAYAWQRWTSWILLIGLGLHIGYMRFYRYPEVVVKNNLSHYLVNVTDQQGLIPLSQKLNFKVIQQNGATFALCPTFGTAELLVVRDAFHSLFKCFLYTIFVLAACFHAFNGLWTFMITWGVILRVRSQQRATQVCVGLMGLIAFLGLASIWGTYWSFMS